MRFVAVTRTGLSIADGEGVRETWSGDARCLITAGNELLAGTQGSGVLRSLDGGETWVSVGLDGTSVKSLAASGDLVVAGAQPPAVFLSEDRGSSWIELPAFRRLRRWFWWQPAERPHTPYVSALAASGDTILAGIEAGCVFRSTDRGRTWARARGAAFDCHALGVVGDDAYEGAGFGPARSTDRGATWMRDRSGLDRRYVMAASVDPADPGCWYVAAAPLRTAHARDSRARIFRWDSGGWRALTDDLEQLPHALACPAPDQVHVGLRDGTVLSSTDRGATWTEQPFRFDRIRALGVLYPQANGGASAG